MKLPQTHKYSNISDAPKLKQPKLFGLNNKKVKREFAIHPKVKNLSISHPHIVPNQ